MPAPLLTERMFRAHAHEVDLHQGLDVRRCFGHCQIVNFVGCLKYFGVRREDACFRDNIAMEAAEAVLSADHVLSVASWTKSNYSSQRHMAEILRHNENMNLNYRYPKSEIWDNVEDFVFSTFAELPQVRPLAIEAVRLPSGSYPGFGYYGKRGDDLVIEKSIRKARTILDDAFRSASPRECMKKFTPYVCLARTQFALESQPKVRNVDGSADHNCRIEATIARPIYDVLIAHRMTFPITIGLNLDELRLRVLGLASSDDAPEGGCFLNADWPGFDRHVQPWEQHFAFRVIGSMLNLEFNRDRILDALNFSFFFHVNKALLAPDDRLYYVYRGIPSGSYFTALVGSIINLARIAFFQLSVFRQTLPMLVLGDDSLQMLPHLNVSQSGMDDVFKPVFGTSIDRSKSRIFNDVHGSEFLGHIIENSFVTRSAEKVLLSCLFTEREDNSDPAFACGRLDSINRDSGCQHAFVSRMIEWIKRKYQVTEYRYPEQDYLTRVLLRSIN